MLKIQVGDLDVINVSHICEESPFNLEGQITTPAFGEKVTHLRRSIGL